MLTAASVLSLAGIRRLAHRLVDLLAFPHGQHCGGDLARYRDSCLVWSSPRIAEPGIGSSQRVIGLGLRDGRDRGALEDALQRRVVVSIQPSRLDRLDPMPALRGLDPIGRRARDDAEATIAPELALRAKAVGRDHAGDHQRSADRPQPGSRFEDLGDLV